MQKKTALTHSLEVANANIQYDINVKNVLANKVILAWILKYTIKEFMPYTVDEIIPMIEGDPEISRMPIYPGSSKIVGLSTEDAIINEGKITYDIRFIAFIPNQERVKLIINVEAQKKFNPGYDIVTRGIFYGARMLSSQLDTEFTTENYDNIKKVYSIWICMNAPKYAQNTITSYHMTKNDIVGNNAKDSRYDLLEVITICLGNIEKPNAASPLIDMLSVLLNPYTSVSDKEITLETEYNISTIEIKEEMRQMCNLSDVILDKGISQGISQGNAETTIKMIDTYVKKHKVSIDEALDALSISMVEYNEAKKILEKQ